MASVAQALANAANAQKSTGPRTSEGKSNAKQNSLSHGLNAEASTLFAHSPLLAEAYQIFRAQLIECPTKGKSEELAFDRWAFSAFQASRAREMEAMAESDARVNFGDDHYERRWQRMVQTRLRLDRDAATARKEFFAIQNERLCMEAEQAAEAKRSLSDKLFLREMREKAKERNCNYQSALLAYKQRLAQGCDVAPPPLREMNLDLVYEAAPDMATVRQYMADALETCRPQSAAA